MPEALGRERLDLGEAELPLVSPSPLRAAGSHSPQLEGWQSAHSWEPHSQPQTDLSWPDPAKQFGKRG